MTNLEKQYKQNVKAYEDMGLKIPTDLETVKSKLAKYQKEAISKGRGQLIISPAITKDFTFYDLVEAFDKKQKINTYIWNNLWDQYNLSGLESISVIDNKSSNDYGDPFVQYADRTLKEQKNIKAVADFMNPVEALILSAILRLDNKRLVPNTCIRFPQLGYRKVDGYSIVGAVNSLVGQLMFDRDNGGANPSDGVGVVVGQRLSLNTSPFLSASSLSEKEAIHLLKDKGYKVFKEF